jgi:hypothetical protein
VSCYLLEVAVEGDADLALLLVRVLGAVDLDGRRMGQQLVVRRTVHATLHTHKVTQESRSHATASTASFI